MTGENFKGGNWSGSKEKIQQLIHYTPSDDLVDISDKLSLNKGDSLLLPLPDEGTHMIIFNSNNSFISLEAAKFNEYLMEAGLNNAAAYRKENNEEDKKSTEHYQRSIKTILQVSSKLTDACTKPTSLPLDIIPEKNPYEVQAGSKNAIKVRFQVLFQKKALAGALVKIWYHVPGKIIQMDTLRTDKKGWVNADRHPGRYMISCIHMEHTPADNEAEWQSYWGSLSFEYSQFFPGSATR